MVVVVEIHAPWLVTSIICTRGMLAAWETWQIGV